MVCRACGYPVESEIRFCSKCGLQISGQPVTGPSMTAAVAGYGVSPVYAIPTRVQRNLQALGVMWCVYGAYRVIGGLVAMFFLRAMSMGGYSYYGWNVHRDLGNFGSPWMAALVPVVGVISVVGAVLAFAVGLSLLARKPWGRVLGIVVAILTLFRPLLGTALGIYTLWALAPAASGAEYDAIADRS